MIYWQELHACYQVGFVKRYPVHPNTGHSKLAADQLNSKVPEPLT